MTKTPHKQHEQTISLAGQLDEIGDEQSILREPNESDTDYAQRMIYEIDVYIEELWDVQDQIRAAIREGSST